MIQKRQSSFASVCGDFFIYLLFIPVARLRSQADQPWFTTSREALKMPHKLFSCTYLVIRSHLLTLPVYLEAASALLLLLNNIINYDCGMPWGKQETWLHWRLFLIAITVQLTFVAVVDSEYGPLHLLLEWGVPKHVWERLYSLFQ